MIFTRSGFSGMQRYAAATWSGDVGHDLNLTSANRRGIGTDGDRAALVDL